MRLIYSSITIAIAAIAAPAYATHCNNGLPDSYYPACVKPVETVPTSTSNRFEQDQQQSQHQNLNARQTNRLDSRNANTNNVAASGGNSTNRNQNSSGASSSNNGSNLTLQGAQSGSGDMYVNLPNVPPTAPAFVASANLINTVSRCGPMQRVEVVERVTGTHHGVFSDSQEFLGNTEITKPYLNDRGEIQQYMFVNGHWFGHEVIYFTSVNSVSSSSNFSIGGFGSNGGANGGGGSSGAMQRQVTTIQLRECDLGPSQVSVTRLDPPGRLVGPSMMPHRTVAKRKATARSDDWLSECIKWCKTKH